MAIGSVLLLFILSVSLSCAGVSSPAAAERRDGGSGQLWCVAKNNADDPSLQSALNWACGLGGADCGSIQPGGPCYVAGDLQSVASYAFNDYYRHHGATSDACDFSGSAALTSLDPSHGSCSFPSSSSTTNGNFTGTTLGTNLGPGGSDTSAAAAMNRPVWIGALNLAAVALVLMMSSYFDM